jgi:hypothetical protein
MQLIIVFPFSLVPAICQNATFEWSSNSNYFQRGTKFTGRKPLGHLLLDVTHPE